MSNVVSFEPRVNSTIEYFFKRLDDLFVDRERVCNFAFWLQAFAFDVIGEITLSKRIWSLGKSKDIKDIMESIWKYCNATSPVSQTPWLDLVKSKTPILQRMHKAKPNPIVGFAVAQAKERHTHMEKASSADEGVDNKYFLSRFLEVIQKDKQIQPFVLTAWITSNVTAGSDTTASL